MKVSSTKAEFTLKKSQNHFYELNEQQKRQLIDAEMLFAALEQAEVERQISNARVLWLAVDSRIDSAQRGAGLSLNKLTHRRSVPRQPAFSPGALDASRISPCRRLP